jgi:glycosyltransferase involved in cell wall biosynthesis
MKVAIVHDYLTEMGGAERVVETMMRLFPEAPLYTSAFNPGACPAFAGLDVRTTFADRLTSRKGAAKALFFTLPFAFRSLDLDDYDLVLSSSSGFAHHVRCRPGAHHVCYCHNPPRFLWQPDAYFRGQPSLRRALAPALAVFRRLDRGAAGRVDAYVGNSATVAERIRKTYGRDATVVHPPVDTSLYERSDERSGRFLVLSRLLAYKRIDLAVDAAAESGLPLDVVGDGPDRARLEARAGKSVRFHGRLQDDDVRELLARCAALIQAGEEDFGLTVIEAQASGRPPIAFAAGGALETVEDGVNGFLFAEQSAVALAAAMRRAENEELDVATLRKSARRFDREPFASKLMDACGLSSGELKRPRGLRPEDQPLDSARPELG